MYNIIGGIDMKKHMPLFLSVILFGSSLWSPIIAASQDTETVIKSEDIKGDIKNSEDQVLQSDTGLTSESNSQNELDSSEEIKINDKNTENIEAQEQDKNGILETEDIHNVDKKIDQERFLRNFLSNPDNLEVNQYLNNPEKYKELLEVIKEDTDYADGTRMPAFRSFSNERSGKAQGVAKFLGISKAALLSELQRHEHDNYYLGTPFRGLWTPQKMCMSPLGAPNEYGPGFNCTGFVATAFQKSGGNLGNITRVANAWCGEYNAYNWRDALRANTQ